MLPQLPQRSRRSGAMKAQWDSGLKGVATVATTFINLNKKKGFRKNFFILCGNSGNYGNIVYIAHRLIKKSRFLKPSSHCNNEVHEVKGVNHATT